MDRKEIQDLLRSVILSEEDRRKLCHAMVTDNPQMERLVMKYFRPEDYRRIFTRRIGDGLIGGKACGLLMARTMMELLLPKFEERLTDEPVFFIGTQVFEEYLSEGKRFPKGYDDQLSDVLHTYGDAPMIVRSSSRLEDGFEGSFSGKYASIFCCNQGTEEEKLQQMKDAVCQVYESVFGEAVMKYRKKRNLLKEKEQMGILIQKVAGERLGDYYFPAAAGMGCSYNPYKWSEDIDPEAGMLRIVLGLGTRAVERTPGDYPRLVSLNKPKANIRTTVAERHKFSQRNVDVIDLNQRQIVTKRLAEILDLMPDCYKKLTLSRDKEAENYLWSRGVRRKVYFADCQGFVENDELILMLQSMEKIFEREYEKPVDIEFSVVFDKDGRWKLKILQCRPLRNSLSEQVDLKNVLDEKVLFDIRRTSMRSSKKIPLDYVVWVDPQKYYEYEYYKKPEVAALIRRVNQYFEGKEQKLLLLVPGRIGTSSPELGVPVIASDIYQFCAICEVAYSKVGYNPELSYGSHMFQDLVEADIYYGAINENSKTRIFQPEILKQYPEMLGDIDDVSEELREIVQVYKLNREEAKLILDARQGRAVCAL